MLLLVGAALGAAPGVAGAADLGSIGGFDARLDVTVRLSLGLRVPGANAELLQNPNGDDGDRAFAPGPSSERLDTTAQLDLTRGDLGIDLSGDGWYDAVYHQADANRSADTFNSVTVAPDRFSSGVRALMGGTIELGNAYVHDRVEIDGVPVTVRIGRQSLLWGESLFFPQDGIAAGQAPIDEIKQLSQPLVQDREVYLPTTQAYVRVPLAAALSLEAYWQFEYRRDRIPGVGSYFSTFDLGDIGGARAFLPGGATFSRLADQTPGDLGQFGVALRHSSDRLDLGLYALRFDAKQPSVVQTGPDYRLVFPSGIDMLGASAATYIGGSTVSVETSLRWHMPLAKSLLGAAIPKGRTAKFLLTDDGQLPPGRLWDGAALDAELVSTALLGIESAAADQQAGTDHLATALVAVFTPQYFQVMPSLDLSIPVGIGWNIAGNSPVDPGIVAGTGSATVSLSATWRSVWQARLSYTRFFGDPRRQPLADRDFVELQVGRTF